MKIKKSFPAASSLMLKTIVALGAAFYFLPLSASAQTCSQSPYCRFTDCMPVVYLFRHAEEGNSAKTIDQNTLLPAGLRHANLYKSMIARFQEKFGYCPVNTVFAMARKNAPSAPQFPNDLGTTNPFFTARPLSVAVRQEFDTSVPRNDGSDPLLKQSDPYYDPITSTSSVKELLGVVQPSGLLYEYLPDFPTRDSFRQAIKDAISFDDSQQFHSSVAIFWSSQGLNEVAEILGQPIPAYANNHVPAQSGDYKAPRNAVFVFSNYNEDEIAEPGAQVTGKFDTISVAPTDKLASTTGAYIQCFNYFKNDFNLPSYYCKFNENLSEAFPSDSINLSQLRGAICDVNNLTSIKDPTLTSTYIGFGDINGTQCF
jgi:hypothetical protein